MNEPTYSAFRDAIADRAVDRLQRLIRAGVNFALRADLDLTQFGSELLKLAVEAELEDAAGSGEEPHVDLTGFLMIGGADPRRPVDDVSALELAAARGHWLAALVMERWGRPPLPGPPPRPSVSNPDLLKDLLQAIEHERFSALHDMLAVGADVHTEASGESLLVQAMYSELDMEGQVQEIHLDCSALLLAMGADPLRPPHGATGPTAAQRAAERGYGPVVLLYQSWTRDWAPSNRWRLLPD